MNYIVLIVQWLLRRLWKLYGTLPLAQQKKSTWPNWEVMQTIANKAMTIVDSLVWQIPHVWKTNCQWNKIPDPKRSQCQNPFFLDGFLKQKENTCVNNSWKLSFFLDRCCLHDTDTFNFTKKYQHHVPTQCFCFCVYWHWTTRGCCVKHVTFSTWKKPLKPWDPENIKTND